MRGGGNRKAPNLTGDGAGHRGGKTWVVEEKGGGRRGDSKMGGELSCNLGEEENAWTDIKHMNHHKTRSAEHGVHSSNLGRKMVGGSPARGK